MSAGPTRPHVDVLRNIASYHREHERFYTANQLATAADLAREANRLKVVADAWLDAGPAPDEKGRVDYADPRYRAAGCEDLNVLGAIAGIGVLFMEGEGEPAEIRGLKAKLRGIGFGLVGAGQWLSEKMDAAWERERVLLTTPELIDAAWSRFQTIVTNGRGSRQMALAGKLLGLAADRLDSIDFTPARVRADRESSGRALRAAGWMIDMAARLLAKSGADLGENDLHWTEYRDTLDRLSGRRRTT